MQLTFQLAGLAMNHAPLVEALLQRPVNNRPIASPRDLVPLLESDWVELLARTGVPRGVPGRGRQGTGPQLRRHRRRHPRRTRFPDSGPRRPYSARRAIPGPPTATTSSAFSPPIRSSSSNPTLWTPTCERIPTSWWASRTCRGPNPRLRRVQRVFRLSPPTGRTTVVRMLLADGVDSAWAVSRLGKAAFADTYGVALGAERASLVYVQLNERLPLRSMCSGARAWP